MKFDEAQPLCPNKPHNESTVDCWNGLVNAWSSFKASKLGHTDNLDKKYQAVLDIRMHQEHQACKLSSFEELGVTEDEVNKWLISNSKKTRKMLHDSLKDTINKEIRDATKTIKKKYIKKFEEYSIRNKLV